MSDEASSTERFPAGAGDHAPASPLAAWHEVVRTRNPRELDALLADEVVFHSPVVHTPQRGKALALDYLQAAVRVFGNESFRYVRELRGERDAMLEFEVEIDGVHVNGVDLMRWNDVGRIVDFKVLLRPLKAVLAIQQKMAVLLQARS
ncbi:MAG: nuclear transport factor 2 family protein [Thermoanaerobaculia bacterium]